MTTTNTNLNVIPSAGAAAYSQGEVSGDDPVAKLRPDNKVWKQPEGFELYEGRTINTADGAGKMTMRDVEKVMEAFSNSPAWAAQRLFEDSANGTPVQFSRTFQLTKDNYEYSDDPDVDPKVTESRYATVRVDVKVVDGELKATTRFEMSKKEFAKTDLVEMFAKSGIQKRPAAVLEATAQLTPEGHLNDVQLGVRLENLPKFNSLAIAEYGEFIKDIREQALKGGKEASNDVQASADNFIGELERLVPTILGAIADDADLFDYSISPRDDAMKIHGSMGDSTFEVNVDNLFAGSELDEDEVCISATVAGEVEDVQDWEKSDVPDYDIGITNASLRVDQTVNLVPPQDGMDGDWKATTADGAELSQGKAEQLAQILMFAVASFADM